MGGDKLGKKVLNLSKVMGNRYGMGVKVCVRPLLSWWEVLTIVLSLECA